MTTPAQDWIVALNKYVSTVRTGGTPEQRKWAWDAANKALDAMLKQEHARSRRVTEELEAA